MDKEQARFVLNSFRPDGGDCGDADFAEALRLANEDLELCEWLAESRAFDAEFARALERLAIPASLRDGILGQLAAARGGLPVPEDRADGWFATALEEIQPPAELRSRVLAAMNRTGRQRQQTRLWRRTMFPLAAAAGIAVALFVTVRPAPAQSGRLVTLPKLPVDVVQAEFIRAFESPHFTLDERREDHDDLFTHLRERKLPCPCSLPKGLANVKGIGCRELVIDGRVGSIICFNKLENGIIHLVVFRRLDVDGDLPCQRSPELRREGKWAVARWADDDRVFVLIGDQIEPSRLMALF